MVQFTSTKLQNVLQNNQVQKSLNKVAYFVVGMIGIVALFAGVLTVKQSNSYSVRAQELNQIVVNQSCFQKVNNLPCPTSNNVAQVVPNQDFIYKVSINNNTGQTLENLQVTPMFDQQNFAKFNIIQDISNNSNNLDSGKTGDYFYNVAVSNAGAGAIAAATANATATANANVVVNTNQTQNQQQQQSQVQSQVQITNAQGLNKVVDYIVDCDTPTGAAGTTVIVQTQSQGQTQQQTQTGGGTQTQTQQQQQTQTQTYQSQAQSQVQSQNQCNSTCVEVVPPINPSSSSQSSIASSSTPASSIPAVSSSSSASQTPVSSSVPMSSTPSSSTPSSAAPASSMPMSSSSVPCECIGAPANSSTPVAVSSASVSSMPASSSSTSTVTVVPVVANSSTPASSTPAAISSQASATPIGVGVVRTGGLETVLTLSSALGIALGSFAVYKKNTKKDLTY